MKNRYFAQTCFCLFISSTFANANQLGPVLDKLEQINTMRESLASTIDSSQGDINEGTFKQVCAPVGQSIKTWAEAEKLKARQISDKYRNPNHKSDPKDSAILKELRKDPKRLYIVEAQEVDGIAGWQVYRRIDVQQGCLNCHGEASKRPEFIKTKYPQDLAYGFKIGDLRGAYSVWIQK